MNEHQLVPHIRFQGFADEWENSILGKMVKFLNGRAYKQSELLVEGKYPVLRVGNFYTNDSWYYSNLELPKSAYANKGDLLYTWSATFGPHIWNGNKVIYHYHIWKIELSSYLDKKFLLQLLIDDRAKLLINTNGSTMIHLTKSEMERKIIKVPQLSEQQKIGNLFAKLDQLLDLQQQELDQLDLLKKTLLQNLFPAQGTKIPELRFQGFADEWEKKRLKEISKIVGGGTPDTKNCDYWDGDINWYSPTEIGNKPYVYSSNKKITKLGLKKSSAKIHPSDTTILFTSRAGIGDMAILKKPAATNQGFQSIELVNSTYPYFIYSYGFEIKRQANTLASGSTFLEISKKDMEKITLNLPTLDEQQKIGTFLAKLDHLIELEQQKLDKIKQVKKALLQNMFVE
ncbi:restriction endonuclease subunit S [Lactobacillus sp. ESL0225]|uniref:restriction endonuclease subunit S n=1 Tax=Lactobacillus sp. ESL0225 TaxID=2069351 RepID=UPI000EFD3926|nr:restriction endonuclease subunit S [Lactobacillus sp. ESL0225]RMC48164.1 restriction endonuclease subunit S [Lactobacillus sp. ESL0225]